MSVKLSEELEIGKKNDIMNRWKTGVRRKRNDEIRKQMQDMSHTQLSSQ